MRRGKFGQRHKGESISEEYFHLDVLVKQTDATGRIRKGRKSADIYAMALG